MPVDDSAFIKPVQLLSTVTPAERRNQRKKQQSKEKKEKKTAMPDQTIVPDNKTDGSDEVLDERHIIDYRA
jgi:hypothetical protein